ncbi:hypothetical protein AAKU52_003176 [Pedobacter sp. CG_S7]|uniref:TonB-dependent receptor n=1 Tax=Pedobacter sp. CG_S7 TaxID=3143930 RepID=UPI0033979772
MTFRKLIYTTVFFITAGTFSLKAQDKKEPEKKPDDKTIAEEIEVIRPYKPVLAEAVKLRRSPDLNDVKTYKAKFNYGLTDRKLELNADINKLQAQQVAEERQTELTNNYLKAGLGTSGTTLAEAFINIGRDEALQLGGFFRHFGQEGKLKNQKFNQQQFSVFGKSIADQFTLSGRLNYQRNGLYFYGQDPNNSFLNENPAKQSFNFFEAEGEIASKYTTDEDALSYAAKINGYMWGDHYDAKENSVNLNAYLNKRISNFNLGLAAAVEMGNTKDMSVSVNNNLLKLNPYIRLQTNGVKINAGINFVQEFGTFSETRIFPAVTADFTLIPDYLQLFGELNGDVNKNTLKEFSDDNPFLNTNIEIQNTVEKLSFTGGIKGTAGPGFGYKAKVYHKELSQMPLFVNNFNKPASFDVIYDFGTMKLLGLEGELSVQVSNSLKWTGKINLENYKPERERESWFKPQLRVSSNLLFNFNDKLSFDAAIAIQDDTKAKLYLAQPDAPYVVPNPDNERVVNVKGFVDLGIGAAYKINNQFSVFAKANNLLNTNNGRFLYYQAIGFNGFGGLTYSF